MVRSFGLAALLVLVGCGGSDEAPCEKTAASAIACEAGKSDVCACTDGSAGAQVCAADGSAWGACECVEPSGEAGASSTDRPKFYAFKAAEVCERNAGGDSVCERFAGAFHPVAFKACSVPSDGILVSCVQLSDDTACCATE